MMLSVNDRNFSHVVLESPNPVLVNFWAPWCGVCLLINPFLDKIQKEWDNPLEVVSINADNNFQLANTYRLKNLPTLILFNQGRIIQRIEEIKGRDELIQQLNQVRMNTWPRSA
ncbi:thioredoxin family protein [Crocosphaera watsonii WH 8501]|uniref:Thioredoxin n=6 Tax=Crocosphaera watsonii TaxID=263511 RepID=Q4C674_CROWT|nr:MULTISPECIES: thioredoxin domain-containing protein [Crocosphaera]EAM51690.1 Thioredoxin-related [Crocosphaera watsonii WH 8501]EHJ13607.1 thioredoxin M [Crocosphaera watsonii WH 0003]MCH2243593.1 thioredoxin domain-containing protein [Crocosphaera sp.]